MMFFLENLYSNTQLLYTIMAIVYIYAFINDKFSKKMRIVIASVQCIFRIEILILGLILGITLKDILINLYFILFWVLFAIIECADEVIEKYK